MLRKNCEEMGHCREDEMPNLRIRLKQPDNEDCSLTTARTGQEVLTRDGLYGMDSGYVVLLPYVFLNQSPSSERDGYYRIHPIICQAVDFFLN